MNYRVVASVTFLAASVCLAQLSADTGPASSPSPTSSPAASKPAAVPPQSGQQNLSPDNITVTNFFRHPREFWGAFIAKYSTWTYFFLFLIVFCETGLVFTPFLPGDSLLFVSGYFASVGSLELGHLLLLLVFAPILGDSTNYWIGRFIGPKIFHKEKVRLLNKEYLDRAHKFYEKHGGKAVAIGRFLPIIRTFVPFVAGIGKMAYGRFLAFSVLGTIAWINLCILAGYFFGGSPFIKDHFEMVIVAIIVISLIPAAAGYIHTRLDMRRRARQQ